MKKFLLILLLVFGGLFILSIFKNKVGDIRPAIIPSQKTVNQVTFVSGLGKPRDLEFSPGGKLLVSDPGRGEVIALPEKNKVVENLNNPHGIAFHKNKLFIAEETRVSRYSWDEKNLKATLEKKLFDLPSGGRHFTRSIVFNKKGQMFVVIGSTCDVCFEKDSRISTVLISDSEGRNPRVFAKGLRNSVFITINPKTDELWGTEMGRDFLGDELPPDEVNIIREGKDYGWPVCYGDKVYDTNFGQRTPDYCKNTEAPVYKIAAHSAPLGLTFHENYLYIAYHGSWNRSTPIGYKVVRLKLRGNEVVGEEEILLKDVRPVDVIFDKDGNLYVSDDRNGIIYKLSGV